MRRILAGAWTIGLFSIAGIAFAQTVLPVGVTEAQMNAAFKDLSALYGAPIVRLDQAKAICNEEQYIVDCANIGKKNDLFSDERTKQVDILLTEFKGEAAEKLKQCEDVACLVEVATSIARRLNSENPSVARTVELTPDKVGEKRTIVETAKSLGVDVEACRIMDPDTASIELLRSCARLAKHENIQKYIPQETKDRAGEVDASIALKESLVNGQVVCGDNTLEGCGNFCLAPSSEAQAKGVAGIPAVCRQIANRFFGNEGVQELERAYTAVQETFDTLTERTQSVVFTTSDGRALTDPSAIGAYLEEAGSRGDVVAVTRGMDFLIARGFITSEDRDFALTMVRKIQERGPIDFGACRADPSRCADVISEEDRGQFTIMGEIEKVMRSEMAKRGVTDPLRCSSDREAGQSCLEAARAALPQIERLAGNSPQAQAIVSDIRQKIRFGEAGLEARSRVEERFRTTGDFLMGGQRFKSIAELEAFCKANSQQCLNETARDGIFSKDVAAEKYEHSIDVRYNVAPFENVQGTPLTQGDFNKEEALQQFKQWLDNPTGAPPIPPGYIDVNSYPQYPTPYYYSPYTSPVGVQNCQFATVMPTPCKMGEYRQESISEFGCPVYGSCIPFSTKTEPAQPDGLNICPALPTVASCPAGEEKIIAFSSPECGTYYSCRPVSQPPILDDQSRTTTNCERYGSGWHSMDSSGNCFGPLMTEYRTASGALNSCASAPVYGCSSSDVPPSPLPSPSGQREQVWNNLGLRSWIRSDANTDRIESLKSACATVSSQANVWLPGAGTQSSIDFGMPDPGKCAKATACLSTQYFDGVACVTNTSPQPCGYNEYWNGSACAPSTTQTPCPTGQYWNGSACAPSTTQTTGSCSSELIGLLGSGCHSMGNAWFNGDMTSYVSSGQTVRNCTIEYLSGCTTGTNTQTQTSCPTGQYWSGSSCVSSTTQTCPSGQYVNGACAYPSTTTCSSDQYWNGSACVTSTTQTSSCPSGQYWSGSSCVSTSSTDCPSGQYWNGISCVNSSSTSCPSGQYWDGSACRTTETYTAPSYSTSCPSGQYWNGSACQSSESTYTAPAYTPPPSGSEPISYLFCPDGHDWNGAYCTLSPRSPFERYTANAWSALRSLLGL